VRRDASLKNIKRAYREMSKRHHPDKGGDKNTFSAITEAYQVLSDQEKRKEYDLTGKVTNENIINTQAIQIIVSTFVHLLQKADDNTNYVEEIKGAVKRDLEKWPGIIQKNKKDLERIKGKQNKIKNRFDKENIFESSLKQIVTDLENIILEAESRGKSLERAKVILKEYVQEMPKQKIITNLGGYMGFGGGTAATYSTMSAT